MSEKCWLDDQNTLHVTRLLPGPIDRVWAFLTEPDKRAQWLAGGRTGTAPGEPVEFEFRHDRLTPHKDDLPPEKYAGQEESSMTGEVLIYEPPHRLKFTWPEREGDWTTVDIRLSDQPDGRVRLDLSHAGIKQRTDLIGAAGGWHVHLDILVDHIEGRTPPPFWSTHEAAEKQYDRLFKDVGE